MDLKFCKPTQVKWERSEVRQWIWSVKYPEGNYKDLESDPELDHKETVKAEEY